MSLLFEKEMYKIIVEVKAKKNSTDIDYAQTLHYLKATNKRLGLRINFGELSLKVKRIINGSSKKKLIRENQ